MNNMTSNAFDDAAESNSSARKALSRRFCYVLEAGGWRRQKRIAQSRTRNNELIDNCGQNEFTRFVGGSHADGTALTDSDTDFMFVYRNMFVVTNQEDLSKVPSSTTLFLMEQDGHRPCYPVLRLLRLGPDNKIKTFLDTQSGFKYLSSAKMKRKHIMHADYLYGEEIIDEHGPCAQLSFDEQENRMCDMSYSIQCVSWPPCAMEWIIRERKYGNPNKRTIQEVVETACSVVPKCNDRMQDLEWRISFLLGERILVWNFTTVQYYCFIYLKQIMKSFLSKEFQEILSSFVIKTVLFWEIEESDPNKWQEDLLLDRITDCLTRLRQRVQERILPHYFARENNILTGKVSEEDSQKLVSMLSSMMGNIKFFCHVCFGIDCTASSCVICHNAPLLVFAKGRGFSRCIVPSYFDKVEWWDSGGDRADLETYIAKLNVLCDDKEQRGISPSLREYTRETTATGMGIVCNRKAMESYDESIRAVYISVAEHYYKLGADGENVTGKLHLSGFYCQQGQFEKALLINNPLEDKVYFDPESKTFLRFKGGITLVDEDIVCNEFTDAEQIITMHFFSEDSRRVHRVIAMECISCSGKLDSVEIHLLVYLSFLQFLILYNRGGSLMDMKMVLKRMEECALLSWYKWTSFGTACNVVGYCYFLAGNNKKALEYFWKSFNARPSLQNPCLYHSLILIKDYFESKRRDL